VALSAAGIAWFRGDPGWIVAAILRRRLRRLPLDPESLETFTRDYLASRERYRATLTRLAPLAWPLRVLSPYRFLPLGHPLRRLEDNVVSRYLLSTDFFQNGSNESRTPRYVGFHEPLDRPCANPFAQRPDPP
jgi:hypothetical protein